MVPRLLTFALLACCGGTLSGQAWAPQVISSGTGGICGELRSSQGSPAAGAVVYCRFEDGRSWRGRSDAQGRFRLGSLPPGAYWLVAQGPDGARLGFRARVLAGLWARPAQPLRGKAPEPILLAARDSSYDTGPGPGFAFGAEPWPIRAHR